MGTGFVVLSLHGLLLFFGCCSSSSYFTLLVLFECAVKYSALPKGHFCGTWSDVSNSRNIVQLNRN